MVRGERKNFFFIELYEFLSRKIHLELLQSSRDKENYCSNFKKKFEKVLLLEKLLEWVFYVFFFSKIDFREPIGDALNNY